MQLLRCSSLEGGPRMRDPGGWAQLREESDQEQDYIDCAAACGWTAGRSHAHLVSLKGAINTILFAFIRDYLSLIWYHQLECPGFNLPSVCWHRA